MDRIHAIERLHRRLGLDDHDMLAAFRVAESKEGMGELFGQVAERHAVKIDFDIVVVAEVIAALQSERRSSRDDPVIPHACIIQTIELGLFHDFDGAILTGVGPL